MELQYKNIPKKNTFCLNKLKFWEKHYILSNVPVSRKKYNFSSEKDNKSPKVPLIGVAISSQESVFIYLWSFASAIHSMKLSLSNCPRSDRKGKAISRLFKEEGTKFTTLW